MRSPAFWYPSAGASDLTSLLLSPLGWVYGAGGALRHRFGAGERAGVPVICVGNVTAGGAGKTPAALFLADRLKALGEQPHFLSRGYGGTLPGPVQVDAHTHRAGEVGDEPLLLARKAPAWVSTDRVAGARAAEEAGARLILMDDGFQNPSLQKTLSFLVIDGEAGLGNGRVMPAGPLREPYTAALRRADAVIIAGPGEAGARAAQTAERAGLAVFQGHLAPDADVAASLRGRSVIAFAGIGRPEKFFRTLEECGADVRARHSFADHHPYTQRDLDQLKQEADAQDALLVTTQKDLVRCRDLSAEGIVPLPVTLEVEGAEAVDFLLEQALRTARADPAYTPFEAPAGSGR